MKTFYFALFLSILCYDFSCEDDFDSRIIDAPGTFIFGFGGGNCASDCATIFMVRDSVLFEYGPGLAPNLGPGANALAGWMVMDDQSRLTEVVALRDQAPDELFRSDLGDFGCAGCVDDPFAQVGLFDESGFSYYSYINPDPSPGSGVADSVITYAIEVRELVADLGN
ncbi:MAG: hypothetical protein AAFY36_16365 [Bacteroidota bacterium]